MNEKSIIIAVTGSIAAYRACELVRSLMKQGCSVQVIMTENAQRFVGKLTFQTLTGQPVFINEWEEGMLHIDLKRKAAVFAVIPATANIIGKFACGIADDIVSSTYLAMQCPKVIAPAMNPGMYSSPAVQRNLKILKNDGVLILDPVDGTVICGDEGKGKIADNLVIEKKLIELYSSFPV